MKATPRGRSGLPLLAALVVAIALGAAFWLGAPAGRSDEPVRQPPQLAPPSIATEPAAPAPHQPAPVELPAPAPSSTEPLTGESAAPGHPPATNELTLVLRVVDSHGHPVPRAEIVLGAQREVLAVVGAADMDATSRLRNVTRLRTDDAGRCTLRLRGAHSALFVWHPASGTSGIWSAAALYQAPADQIELRLSPPALLRGRVVSRGGQPLAGAYITFRLATDPRSPASPDTTLRPRIPRPMRTDAAGRFVLHPDTPQTLRIDAVYQGRTSRVVDVSLQPDTPHEVVLTIPDR
ncbi:MAG: hypothetical protein DRQ55_11115 [Planctomycetota bacterium]|nr:MAG: hypothetical protein DRQ55_11115 [Planctomycetota bacterium]